MRLSVEFLIWTIRFKDKGVQRDLVVSMLLFRKAAEIGDVLGECGLSEATFYGDDEADKVLRLLEMGNANR